MMEQGRPSIEQMETWVRDVVVRHGDGGDQFALSGILEDRDRMRSQLADLIDLIRKRYPRLLERGNPMYDGLLADAIGRIEDGGPLSPFRSEIDRLLALVAELESEVNLLHRQRHAAQEDAANARLLAEVRQLSQGEIDRLRARVAEMEKQPRANELHALRNLFAAAGRTIHAASAGGRATLEEINDAWAEVCAAHVANRDLPAPDATPDAWMLETPAGNVMYWITADRATADQFAATYDREAIPLYRHPPIAAPDVAPVPMEELAVLREIVRLLDEARQRYARIPRAGAATRMGDEIDELLNKLYEIGAHPALRSGEAGEGGAT